MLQDALPPIEEKEGIEKTLKTLSNALLNSYDQKRSEIQKDLTKTNLELKKTLQEKQELGTYLYGQRQQVNHLNKSLAKTKEQLVKIANDKLVLEHEWELSEKEIQESMMQKVQMAKDLDTTKRQLDEAIVKINQLQEINGNYNSEIKIQKKLHNKLKKEIETSQQQMADVKKLVDEQMEKNEMLVNQKRELESALESQKSEILVAQQAMAKMHKEVAAMESLKASTEKQWDEAISAMSKRDKAFQALANTKDKTSSRNAELEKEIQLLRKERDELAKQLTTKEQENENLQRKYSFVQQTYGETSGKAEEAKNALVQAAQAEKRYKREIEHLKSLNERQTDEVNRKSVDLSQLSAKLQSMKEQFESKLQLSLPLETALNREEKLKQELEMTARQIEQQGETKNMSLRRENAILKTNLSLKEEQLERTSKDLDNLRFQHKEMSTHYSKLYDEAKHLIYAIERREHDLNFVKAKMQEQEADHAGSFNIILGKLKKELQDTKEEKTRLQNLWLQSQKEGIEAKDLIAQLKQENVTLQTRFGTSEGVNVKTDRFLQESKKEAFEQKLEAAKLYNELRKLQPVITDLKKQNVKLEQQLTEAKLKLEEAHVNQTTTTQMLRAEIRRLMEDRSHLKQDRADKEKQNMNVERRIQLLQEMTDKLKTERYDLQRENYTLKRKCEEAERKLFDFKIKQRKQPVEKKRPKSGQTQFSSTVSDPLTEPHPSMTPSSHSLNTELPLPDFEAWRLRLESLESEKQFLSNENDMLKQKLQDIMQKTVMAENRLQGFEKQSQIDRESQDELMNKIKDLEAKVARGRKVAAYMEKQIKVRELILGSQAKF